MGKILILLSVIIFSGCSTYGAVEMGGKTYSTGIFIDSEWRD